LAISVQIFGQPEIVRIVPSNSFYPAPKVDCAILKITPFIRPKYKISDEKIFFKVLKACFAGKRKQIHNTLKNNLGLEKDKIDLILSEIKISSSARPQELGIEDWIQLSARI
jgi:16S rRNA (adenine1518-N6/adenine1519-N6)-dimethyltransferase